MIKPLFIQRSKDILGGTPVFYGTRVPVNTLIDYFEAGEKIDAFLKDFPSVSRKQVLGVLEFLKEKSLSK